MIQTHAIQTPDIALQLEASKTSAVELLLRRDMVRPSYVADFNRQAPTFADKVMSALSLYDPMQTGEYKHFPAKDLLHLLGFRVVLASQPKTLAWYDLCMGVMTWKGFEIRVFCVDDQESWAIEVPGVQSIPPLRSNYFLQPHLLYALYLIDNAQSNA